MIIFFWFILNEEVYVYVSDFVYVINYIFIFNMIVSGCINLNEKNGNNLNKYDI